ncbi:flagellar hook protein FlgE [Arboricoccus pini]|uniref:Flagellar hook protein FlgE n=1 Tax=Arboricoccus pini TaxID=1963835 RepID=A0A212RBN5_9PROT|nr:flagellar hook protein FlgE [Arboricoccus pini]SNB69594.1 flagellar hook protein FlgE [Arboricoccus pini]
MSLFGSLFSGVSGLNAQSRSLAMISDNIANVSTNGYKRSVAEFGDLVTSSQSRTTYNSGGVQTHTSYTMEDQGLIQGTSSSTDVAISGGGFFAVNNSADSSGEQLYTRDGSFTKDVNGYLVTSFGSYLQGWKLDANGDPINVNKLETVSVADTVGLAQATTNIKVAGNLNAETTISAAPATGALAAYAAGQTDSSTPTPVKPTVNQNITIYDSLGRSQTVTLGFVKTGTNTWYMEAYGDPAQLDATAHPNGLIASGNVTFGTDGTLTTLPSLTNSYTPSTPASGLAIKWNSDNGAADNDITLNFGTVGTTSGLTQLSQNSGFSTLTQNGSPTGQLNGLSINSDGMVIASFTNGKTRALYQIPIATFTNPGGLDPRSGNLYAASETSGNVYMRAAGEGNAGSLTTSSIEASNVDIADEFSKMIVTQRAYSANTKVISTANDMLDDLLRLK